jgi:DNA-binding HxlR family transcriptional regulator
MRFNELSSKLGNITAATLSSKLKMLEEKKLINRVSHNEIPPKVVYSLTDTGQDLFKIIDSLELFSLKHFGWCEH